MKTRHAHRVKVTIELLLISVLLPATTVICRRDSPGSYQGWWQAGAPLRPDCNCSGFVSCFWGDDLLGRLAARYSEAVAQIFVPVWNDLAANRTSRYVMAVLFFAVLGNALYDLLKLLARTLRTPAGVPDRDGE
jgi:hypothetical protein